MFPDTVDIVIILLPDQVPGLVLWLDANDPATITDTTGAVDQWDDKSDEENNATAAGTERPTTNVRTINGLNVLDFDGTDDLLVLDSQPIVGTEPRTIIVVAVADNSASNNYLISLSDNIAGLGGAYRITAEIGVRIDGANRLFPADAVEDGVDAAIITTTNEANSNIELNASNFQIYKNGVLLTGGTSINPTTLVNTTVGMAAIGNDAGGGGGGRLDGIIGEIIIYDRVLSDIEREQLENYLSRKWHLVSATIQLSSSQYDNLHNTKQPDHTHNSKQADLTHGSKIIGRL